MVAPPLPITIPTAAFGTEMILSMEPGGTSWQMAARGGKRGTGCGAELQSTQVAAGSSSGNSNAGNRHGGHHTLRWHKPLLKAVGLLPRVVLTACTASVPLTPHAHPRPACNTIYAPKGNEPAGSND